MSDPAPTDPIDRTYHPLAGDPATGDLYVHLVADRPASARQREVSPGVVLDYDEHGRPIGVEVLGAVSVEIDGQPVAAPAAQPDETGWMVDQRVEWNPTEGQWVPATIALVSADEEMALIMRADNLHYLNVLTRHLRPASAVSAAPARSVAHSEAADRDDEAVERAQPDDDVPCQVCGRLFTSVIHDCCERLVDARKTDRRFREDVAAEQAAIGVQLARLRRILDQPEKGRVRGLESLVSIVEERLAALRGKQK